MTNTPENLKAALDIVQEFACFSPAPRDRDELIGLAKTLVAMCPDLKKAQALVDELVAGCTRRPTPIVMRRVYLEHNLPEDGLMEWKADLSKFEDAPVRKGGPV